MNKKEKQLQELQSMRDAIVSNWLAMPRPRKPLALGSIMYGIPCQSGAYDDPMLCGMHAGLDIDQTEGRCFVGKQEALGRLKKGLGKIVGLTSSKTEEHWSPPEIVEPGKLVFPQGYDLDPSSTVECNLVCVQANSIYTRKNNGIKCNWFGCVWCNPPSSEKDGNYAWQWWNKAALEFMIGNVRAVIFVVFNPSTIQVAQYHARLEGLPPPQWGSRCEPMQRIDYLRPNTSQKQIPGTGPSVIRGGSPPHPSAIVLLSDEPELHAKFSAAYSHLGEVLPPARMPIRGTCKVVADKPTQGKLFT
jgi:hypothetical protein